MRAGGGHRYTRSGRRATYPMILLLAATMAAACGGPQPASGPASQSPARPTRSAAAPGTTGQPAAPATRSSGTGRYAFPVRGHASYHPTHSGYPGTDIFADCGTPVVAVTDGTVLEVSRVDRFDPDGPRGPFNGGMFVSLLGADGVRYYGSHLSEVRTGIEAGVRVHAGQQVGAVGRTGNASHICHLHFGISPPCRRLGDWWIRRGVVWPAPFLDAWRGRKNRSAAPEVSEWHRDRGCPAAP